MSDEQPHNFQTKDGLWEEVWLSRRDIKYLSPVVRLLTRVDMDEQTECCPSCALPYLGRDITQLKDSEEMQKALEGAAPGENPDGLALCSAVRLPCGHIWGDGCIRIWLETGTATCPLCRKDYKNELARISGEVPVPNEESSDFLFLFGLSADRKIKGMLDSGNGHQLNFTPVPGRDLFRFDRFTLGMTSPSQVSAEYAAQDILNHSNANYPIPGYPFRLIAKYAIRGEDRDLIARTLYGELLFSVDWENMENEGSDDLDYTKVKRHVVYRRPVRDHIEIVEVYPNYVPQEFSQPSEAVMQRLIQDLREPTIRLMSIDRYGEPVIYSEYFDLRVYAIRAFVLLTRKQISGSCPDFACVLRDVSPGHPSAGAIIFVIGTTNFPPPSPPFLPEEERDLRIPAPTSPVEYISTAGLSNPFAELRERRRRNNEASESYGGEQSDASTSIILPLQAQFAPIPPEGFFIDAGIVYAGEQSDASTSIILPRQAQFAPIPPEGFFIDAGIVYAGEQSDASTSIILPLQAQFAPIPPEGFFIDAGIVNTFTTYSAGDRRRMINRWRRRVRIIETFRNRYRR